jgi:hypothetical protein
MKQKIKAASKLKSRKQPVPTFASREEEAAFWQQHSSEDFSWEEVPEPVVVDSTLRAHVRQRSVMRLRSTKARVAQ